MKVYTVTEYQGDLGYDALAPWVHTYRTKEGAMKACQANMEELYAELERGHKPVLNWHQDGESHWVAHIDDDPTWTLTITETTLKWSW